MTPFKIYRLVPGWSFIKKSDSFGYLLGESEYYTISDKARFHILSLIDGKKTDEEISSLLEHQITKAETFYYLLFLASDGYIIETGSSHENSVWQHVVKQNEYLKKNYLISFFMLFP